MPKAKLVPSGIWGALQRTSLDGESTLSRDEAESFPPRARGAFTGQKGCYPVRLASDGHTGQNLLLGRKVGNYSG